MKKNLQIIVIVLLTVTINMNLIAQIDTNEVRALVATIFKSDGKPIVIDGLANDNAWKANAFNKIKIENYVKGNPLDYACKISATWQALWDEAGIYFYIDVVDDTVVKYQDLPDYLPNWIYADFVSLYFNPTGKRSYSPDYNSTKASNLNLVPGFEDVQHKLPGRFMSENYSEKNGFNYAFNYNDSGYSAEFFLPWDSITPLSYINIIKYWGFEVQINNTNDSTAGNNGILMWNDNAFHGPWDNVNCFGYMSLSDSPVTGSIAISSTRVCNNNDSIRIAYVGLKDSIESYNWDFDSGTILQGNNFGPFYIKWNSTGNKAIRLIIKKLSGEYDTLYTALSIYPQFKVTLGNDTTIRRGESITLNPKIQNGAAPLSYYWNGILGSSSETYTITSDIDINVQVKDKNRCTSMDAISIKGPDYNFTEPICLVTVDSITGKNAIVWSKTSGKRIKEYEILKETSVAGSFDVIGTVPFSSEGIFVDNNSNPSQHADRYKLKTIDITDYQIGLSDYHQTIHLAISQGLPGTYNLIWTPYTGFSYSSYYIYKGSSPDNLKLISMLSSSYNQYTDTSAGVSYYQVVVRKSSPCDISKRKAGGVVISQTASNIENNLSYLGLNSAGYLPFNIYPNPFSSNLVIEGTVAKQTQMKVEIYNVTGMKIYEYSNSTLASGSYRITIQSSEIKNASVLNILKVSIGPKVYFTKIIKR